MSHDNSAAASPVLLVGDIGGTNARFALADVFGHALEAPKTVRCAEYATANKAIDAYLVAINAPRPAVICLAAAGPVVDGAVKLTNNRWRLNAVELRAAFPGAIVCLLNDFEAIACALPFLRPEDCLRIGEPELADFADRDLRVAVLGPGTGLGVAGLLRRNGVLQPVVGEGGHVGFAPQNDEQDAVLAVLRERFERVSWERLVSGTGLQNLYWALSRLDGMEQNAAVAAIFAAADDGDDEHAVRAVELFFELLGQAAGDVALTLGAMDGVFIAGGIVPRYADALTSSRFRRGFENKGRHTGLLKTVATQLIVHEQPGLLGAGYCARQHYREAFGETCSG